MGNTPESPQEPNPLDSNQRERTPFQIFTESQLIGEGRLQAKRDINKVLSEGGATLGEQPAIQTEDIHTIFRDSRYFGEPPPGQTLEKVLTMGEAPAQSKIPSAPPEAAESAQETQPKIPSMSVEAFLQSDKVGEKKKQEMIARLSSGKAYRFENDKRVQFSIDIKKNDKGYEDKVTVRNTTADGKGETREIELKKLKLQLWEREKEENKTLLQPDAKFSYRHQNGEVTDKVTFLGCHQQTGKYLFKGNGHKPFEVTPQDVRICRERNEDGTIKENGAFAITRIVEPKSPKKEPIKTPSRPAAAQKVPAANKGNGGREARQRGKPGDKTVEQNKDTSSKETPAAAPAAVAKEKQETVAGASEVKERADTGKEGTPPSVDSKIDRQAEPEPATLEDAKERIKKLQEKIRELEGKTKTAVERSTSPEASKGKIRRFFEAIGNVFKRTHEFFKQHPTAGVVGGIGTGLLLGSLTTPLVGIFAAPGLAAIYLKKAIKEWTGDEWIGKENGESTTSEGKGQPEKKNFLVRGFEKLFRNRGYYDINVVRNGDFTKQVIQTLKKGKRIKIPLKDGRIIFGDIDDIEQDSIVLSRYRIQKGKEINDSSPEKKKVSVKAVDMEKKEEGATQPASKKQPEQPKKPTIEPTEQRNEVLDTNVTPYDITFMDTDTDKK